VRPSLTTAQGHHPGACPNESAGHQVRDYCCVHAVYALREAGYYETIMVNCNPENGLDPRHDTAAVSISAA